MALPKEQFLAKMAEGRAKAKAERESQRTAIPESIPLPRPNPDGNGGNGHNTLLDETIARETKTPTKPPPIIIPSQMTSAFSHDRGTQAVDYIVRAGDDIKDLLMRTSFASYAHAVALAHHMAKCWKFNCDRHEKEALFVIAGAVSVHGQSREQLIQAIIGQYGNPRAMKGGMSFSDKVKRAAFGTKRDKEEIDAQEK